MAPLGEGGRPGLGDAVLTFVGEHPDGPMVPDDEHAFPARLVAGENSRFRSSPAPSSSTLTLGVPTAG